jgi:hypothetical protein
MFMPSDLPARERKLDEIQELSGLLVFGIRLCAHRVERLAEEGARRGRQRNVEDLWIGETLAP